MSQPPGLYPFDLLQSTAVHEMLYTLEEIGGLFGPSGHIADQELKKAMRLEVCCVVCIYGVCIKLYSLLRARSRPP